MRLRSRLEEAIAKTELPRGLQEKTMHKSDIGAKQLAALRARSAAHGITEIFQAEAKNQFSLSDTHAHNHLNFEIKASVSRLHALPVELIARFCLNQWSKASEGVASKRATYYLCTQALTRIEKNMDRLLLAPFDQAQRIFGEAKGHLADGNFERSRNEFKEAFKRFGDSLSTLDLGTGYLVATTLRMRCAYYHCYLHEFDHALSAEEIDRKRSECRTDIRVSLMNLVQSETLKRELEKGDIQKVAHRRILKEVVKLIWRTMNSLHLDYEEFPNPPPADSPLRVGVASHTWFDSLSVNGEFLPELVAKRLAVNGVALTREEVLDTVLERDAEVLLKVGKELELTEDEITGGKSEIKDWPGVTLDDRGGRIVSVDLRRDSTNISNIMPAIVGGWAIAPCDAGIAACVGIVALCRELQKSSYLADNIDFAVVENKATGEGPVLTPCYPFSHGRRIMSPGFDDIHCHFILRLCFHTHRGVNGLMAQGVSVWRDLSGDVIIYNRKENWGYPIRMWNTVKDADEQRFIDNPRFAGA